MRTRLLLLLAGWGAPALASGTDEVLDRLERALTFSAYDEALRARVSGTVDVEAYRTQLPAPGVLQTTRPQLVTPRLTVFLDAQFGRRWYAFAQVRADRGFDPSEAGGQTRLDEIAVRYTPWTTRRLSVQVGKFATVVGNWTQRHGTWQNPFINAPLPYEYLTGMWDTEAIRNSAVLLQWSHVRPGLPPAVTAIEKTLRIPIVWGPSYATGAVVAGEVGRFQYAFELKSGSLSSRPEAWDHSREQRHHPTGSLRLGYRPNAAWDMGVSASEGVYLREFAAGSTLRGRGRGEYRQQVVASDVQFAWRHLQLWAELYLSRFKIPVVGDADTAAYYVEAKYKLTPRFSAAVRWNQQLFATIPDRLGPTRWGHDVWRIDLAPTFRTTAHTQWKLQYTLQHGDSAPRDTTRLLAAQFTLRF